MSSRGHKMTSAAGMWVATHDETGQRCWFNTVTRQKAYRIRSGVQPRSPLLSTRTSVISVPVSPVLAPTSPVLAPVSPVLGPVSPLQGPMIPPHQGMPPFTMQSPNTGYGVQYMYPAGGYSGAFPPTSPTGTVGMGTVEYPSGSINWF